MQPFFSGLCRISTGICISPTGLILLKFSHGVLPHIDLHPRNHPPRCCADKPHFLREFDVTRLCKPSEVTVPLVLEDEPEFVWKEWLDATLEDIKAGLEAGDVETRRVKPMALVRCSRGGKTRALKEIARVLHKNNLLAIFVSFNDYSPLRNWEQLDPVGALCRRIAFAALTSRDHADSKQQYNDFCTTGVTEAQILHWLGKVPCVLLIDEINNLEQLLVKQSPAAQAFATFLKDIN
jgi:hypothetical protein